MGIALIIALVACVCLWLTLLETAKYCEEYFVRAMNAESEARRLSGSADRAQAEIRALESKLLEREVNHGN